MSIRLFFSILSLMFLASACTNDGASFMIEDRNHSLSLEREQPYFWDDRVNYWLVVTHLPACQRKHFVVLGLPTFKTELWDMGGGTYALRMGKKMYVTETRTCNAFAPLPEEPATGLGTLLGRYQQNREGALTFKREAASPAAPDSAMR